MTARWSPVVLSLLLVSCDISLPAWVEAGSYTLTFDRIDITSQEGYFEHEPVSDDAPARLDVRPGADGVEAAISFPGRPPVEMQAEVVGSELRLQGDAEVIVDPCSGREAWFSFSIPVGSDGTLSGRFSASGQGIGSRSDPSGHTSGAAVAATASGEVTSDEVTPELSPSLGSDYLPWAELRWKASEPLDPAAWQSVLTASTESTSTPVQWTVEPDSAGWPGATVIVGRLLDWEQVSGRMVHFDLAPGLRDPAGNPVPPGGRSVYVMNVGTPRRVHEFDGGPVAVTSWDGELLTGEAGALCEDGTCFQVRLHSASIRGLLLAEGAARVRMRYRVVSTYSAQISPFTLRVALPGVGEAAIAEGTTMLERVEDVHASDWADAVVDLPSADATVVGFSVGVECPSSSTCGVDTFNSCRGGYHLLIERIAAE